jgi:tetratricopeptide (TPR) repeat protein
MNLTLFILFLLFFLPVKVGAVSSCSDEVASLVSAEGRVETLPNGETAWQPTKPGDLYCPEDQVQTFANSRGVLLLKNKMTLRLDQKTIVRFEKADRPSLLEMIMGRGFFFDRFPKSLGISTPFVNANIDGTEFVVEVDLERQTTIITVLEGQVTAMNDAGSVITKNAVAVTKAGGAPMLLPLVHPKDAVAWALYYPPVLSLGELQVDIENQSETSWPMRMRRSIFYGQSGDLTRAFSEIEGVGGDVRFYAYRASLLLSVGRVQEAVADIDRALKLAPKDSLALSLQSILAVAQDKKDEALRLAYRAILSAPNLASPRIALSYAHQAHFNLSAAVESLQAATRLDPESALAWARLAELSMSVGDMDSALSAARRAVAINPNESRGETILGFAYLTQIRIDEAKQAFEKAIHSGQSDPLPRLGLGLAMIRQGDLEGGRQQIEIAVGLDPNNPLIRSYLGKAYYEEGRNEKAANQLEMAKQFDPNDPTPFLYDAIRKQTENRPVEALRDLQTSIQLNDNRAVYRSRLLLDEDLAARGVSLARIYNDLGFQQLALSEGWKSLQADPTNYSAHRFLADSYAALPRHEIARVSALLQSQLLQPLNLTPIQSELAETSLGILEGAGPSESAFNEFTPMFIRNRTAFQANMIGGSNHTFGDSLVAAGLHDRVSYSLGQFHYETDGFRPNNDLTQDIYNLFGQAALSVRSNLQFEWRKKEQASGDIRLQFDPYNFSADLRRSRNEDTARLGYYFSQSANSDGIISVIYRETVFAQTNQSALPSEGKFAKITSTSAWKNGSEGYNADVQYHTREAQYDYVIGGGYYGSVATDSFSRQHTADSEIFRSYTENNKEDRSHSSLYAYSTWSRNSSLIPTLGVSTDFYRSTTFDKDQFNPKFGVTWYLSPATTLRLAGIRTFKRSLVSNQALEPTLVAGFNQFFDDPFGSDAKRYGLGLDHKASQNLFSGIEFSSREVNVPTRVVEDIRLEQQKEQLHKAYLYWTPLVALAFGAEYQFERFNHEDRLIGINGPSELKTQYVPLTVAYFLPVGLSMKLRAGYNEQEVRLAGVGNLSQNDKDRFWLVDTQLEYRFPKQRGMLTILVNNLFNETFKFYEGGLQTSLIRAPTIQPEQTIFLRLTFLLS